MDEMPEVPESQAGGDDLVGTAMEQFEISQKIGEGSIGTIYKAFDLVNQREVAIKFLTREVTTSPQVLERFKREIQVTIKMSHPNIVRGYTAGVWEGCIYYYVMEYIDGSTLHDLMSRQRMTEELAVEIMWQMAQALKYINEFGMVHRDVKPENIMINREGVAKLTDLGLAKAKNDMSGVTLAGTIIGTPLYMSPEQAKGSTVVDIRADIYALGATIYHAVTGEPPFKGNSAPVVIAKQINEVPKPVRELNPALSPGIEYVIAKSMEKDPAKRYQKPGDLVSDLNLLKEGKGACTDTMVPWGALASEAKEKQFHFSYYPNEEDFEFALTAVANKLVDEKALMELLDFQEEMARQGLAMKLSFLSVERGLMSKEQAEKIRAAQKKQRFKETGGEFGSLAVKSRFVSEAQVRKALEVQEQIRAGGEDRLLGLILREMGLLDERQTGIILSQQQSIKHSGEDRMFLKLAQKKQLVAKPLVDKALTIQQNEVSMGSFREIGEILTERKYISRAARDAIMRAIRRKHLTAEPVDDLIAEKEAAVARERTTATVHVDGTVLRKYSEAVDELVKQGRKLYKQREYEKALETWRRVFDILASHDETEKLMAKAKDVVGNLEGHLKQARNFLDLALREWEAVLSIKSDHPGAVSDLASASARIAALAGKEEVPESGGQAGEGQPGASAGTGASGAVQARPDPAEAAAEEGEDEGAEKAEAKSQRLLKNAKRLRKDGRPGQAKLKLVEILEEDPGNEEALSLFDAIVRSQRRTAFACLAAIVILLAAAGTAGVFALGPDESLNLLFRAMGEIQKVLSG